MLMFILRYVRVCFCDDAMNDSTKMEVMSPIFVTVVLSVCFVGFWYACDKQDICLRVWPDVGCKTGFQLWCSKLNCTFLISFTM